MVSQYFLICLVLIISMVASFFNSKFLKKKIGLKNWFWILFYNSVSFGSILVFALIFWNVRSSDENIKKMNFKISEKKFIGSRKSREKPVAVIKYLDLNKEVFFPKEVKRKFNLADSISLEIKKGNLGFDVITKSEIIKR
jgi:hypothetical protein